MRRRKGVNNIFPFLLTDNTNCRLSVQSCSVWCRHQMECIYHTTVVVVMWWCVYLVPHHSWSTVIQPVDPATNRAKSDTSREVDAPRPRVEVFWFDQLITAVNNWHWKLALPRILITSSRFNTNYIRYAVVLKRMPTCSENGLWHTM